jgi:hypothetical protein
MIDGKKVRISSCFDVGYLRSHCGVTQTVMSAVEELSWSKAGW